MNKQFEESSRKLEYCHVSLLKGIPVPYLHQINEYIQKKDYNSIFPYVRSVLHDKFFPDLTMKLKAIPNYHKMLIFVLQNSC